MKKYFQGKHCQGFAFPLILNFTTQFIKLNFHLGSVPLFGHPLPIYAMYVPGIPMVDNFYSQQPISPPKVSIIYCRQTLKVTNDLDELRQNM